MDETRSNRSQRSEVRSNVPRLGRPALTATVAGALVILAIALMVAYAMTGPADRRPTGVETFTATSLRRIFLPLHARGISRPPKITTAALLEGRKIFRQRCSLCHGGTGRGDSSLAPAFYPPVPDLTATAIKRWSDRDLFWTIQNGIRMTGMPAWRSSLNDQETWDVVAYVRHLSERNIKSGNPQGGSLAADLRQVAEQTIDDEGCRDCHTIEGTGATIGPNLSDEWARGRSDAWLMGHFRNPSAYTPGTPMPSFEHLNDRQLQALVWYLQHANE